ncbi:MAG: hypothetical protein JW917_05155 [Ignavibacteria bacterium]|nr:hypothetical protein [Ignavibacteria bacterium]
MEKRIYKYKLDFYYKSLIIYFIFLIVYLVIRGQFSGSNFMIVFRDVIIFIVLIFIVITLIALIVNFVRAKQILFTDDRIILKNRFGQREILFNEIIFVRFSREKGRSIEGNRRVRIVKLKLKNRKRNLRIRIGEFYNERKLIQEFKSVTAER